MADYGQLDDFLDEYDITFSFKGKTYQFKVSADKVLAFHKFWANKKTSSEADIWNTASQLIGGGFDGKEYTFSGTAQELVEAGMSISLIDRVLTAIYIQFRWQNTDLATEFVKEGSVGKAQKALDRKAELEDLAKKETLQAPGETSTDD